MGGSEVPVIFCTVLTTLCRESQSEALQDPEQTGIKLVSMLSILPLSKVTRIGEGRYALLIQRRKCMCC